MTGGALELRGVRHAYGAVQALAGIDLVAEEGSFVALLGPSGCGKSTALGCIAGLLTPDAGEIRLGGRRIDGLPPERRGFGVVFQGYALFPHMTVRRNVGFGLAMRRVPRPEIARRVDEALALVRLQAEAERLPGELSGGQQQRVAIARAVVIAPALVLMDEPLSSLDAALRLEMRGEIRRIHDALGSTTIYVTHDQDEALSMADRVVVMGNGAVRQAGTPAELYERPRDPAVAAFMGFRNLLPARTRSVKRGRAEVELCGTVLSGLVAAGPLAPGRAARVAIRPDDLVATAAVPGDGMAGCLDARVRATEYRGRAIFGLAEAADGTPLHFRSDRPLARGEPVRLAAPSDRVLVFDGEG